MKTNLITLTNLADAYKVDLFILRRDPTADYEYDFEKQEDRIRFYEVNDVFALGKLNGNHYAEFERQFGYSLDRFQSKWLAAVLYDAGRVTGDIPEEVKYDEDTNTYFTPAGKLVGSPETNMLKCLAFLFSCFGQVVGEDANGSHTIEKVSQTEAMEYIDLNLLNSTAVVAEDDEQSFVWRVLGTARGFSLYGNEPEEPVDDEPKNSTPENESSPSTESIPKKRAPKK